MRKSRCDCCCQIIVIDYMEDRDPARLTTVLASSSSHEMVSSLRGLKEPLCGVFEDGSGGRYVDVKLTMELCEECKKRIDSAVYGEIKAIRKEKGI